MLEILCFRLPRVAHTCNSSYSGVGDLEDGDSRPIPGKKLARVPIKKSEHDGMLVRVCRRHKLGGGGGAAERGSRSKLVWANNARLYPEKEQ
jgi:hypothetical protein